MPWTREEKILGVTIYLEAKSFKTMLAKFRKKFNNYPQLGIIVGYTNFKPQSM